MELIKRIDALLDAADNEDLDIIKDCIYTLSDYIDSVIRMESGIKIARVRCNTQKDLIEEIEKLDRSRRHKHNASIVSTKVLNRLCNIYKVDKVFKGDVDDRQAVARFAKEICNSYCQDIISK